MHAVRPLLATSAAVLLPVLLFALPIGLRWEGQHVTAEAGVPGPPICSSTEVSSCEDAGLGSKCGCYESGDCACVSTKCAAPSGLRDALVCTPITTCKAFEAAVSECAGKRAGDSCAGQARGFDASCAILKDGCSTLDDAGVYNTAFPLACVERAASPEPQAPADSDSSGCATTPGPASAFGLVAAAFAFALARLRRRGSTAGR